MNRLWLLLLFPVVSTFAALRRRRARRALDRQQGEAQRELRRIERVQWTAEFSRDAGRNRHEEEVETQPAVLSTWPEWEPTEEKRRA